MQNIRIAKQVFVFHFKPKGRTILGDQQKMDNLKFEVAIDLIHEVSKKIKR
jgi:hypothetical protein